VPLERESSTKHDSLTRRALKARDFRRLLALVWPLKFALLADFSASEDPGRRENMPALRERANTSRLSVVSANRNL